MRRTVSVLLFLSVFACSALAARHEVHVQVRSVLSQTVRGVGVGGPVGGEFTTEVPCSRPYPSDTVSVVSGGRGRWTNAFSLILRIRPLAVFKIVELRPYSRPKTDRHTTSFSVAKESMVGALHWLTGRTMWNDKPKWLADYQHRPFNGFIRVSLRPDGKKKVTYQIEYATKMANLKNSSPSNLDFCIPPLG